MLLQTYSDTNKSTSRMLTVRYSVDLVDYSWYRVTRRATKSYAYIGMTKTAALACAAAKRTQYTRSHASLDSTDASLTVLPTVVTETSCMATVSPHYDAASAWVVDIEVNETDVRCSRTAPTDPASLFTTENAWSYDEPTFPVIPGDLHPERKPEFQAPRRVVKTELYADYSVETVNYTKIDGTAATYYVVTRTATKSYTIVGLSERYARLIANQKVTLYTRDYYVLDQIYPDETYPQSIAVKRCLSSVQPVRNAGNMYSVEIEVSETDVRATDTLPDDPASLFTTENARDYDTATES